MVWKDMFLKAVFQIFLGLFLHNLTHLQNLIASEKIL